LRSTAGTGILGTAAATCAAMRFVPTVSVFVAAFGLLLTGCATVLAGRWQRLPTGRGQLVTGALVGVGVVAATCAVVAIAAAYPAATRDRTHVASLALAVILCGYVVAGLSVMQAVGTPQAAYWGGVGGALVAATAGTVMDLHDAMSVIPLIPPTTAVAAVVAAVVVSVRSGSRAAGRRAGLLTTVLGPPIQFAVSLLLLRGTSTVLLGDTLGGDIVRLAVTPVVMYVLAALAVQFTDLGRPLYR
jgi:hypothetical protein